MPAQVGAVENDVFGVRRVAERIPAPESCPPWGSWRKCVLRMLSRKIRYSVQPETLEYGSFERGRPTKFRRYQRHSANLSKLTLARRLTGDPNILRELRPDKRRGPARYSAALKNCLLHESRLEKLASRLILLPCQVSELRKLGIFKIFLLKTASAKCALRLKVAEWNETPCTNFEEVKIASPSSVADAKLANPSNFD